MSFAASAVIFDFDGTLVDSASIKREAFFELAGGSHRAYKLLEGLLSEDPPLDRYAIARQLAIDVNVSDDVTNVVEDMAERYSEMCRHRVGAAPEIGGASEMLSALRTRGIPLFVSSATPELELLKIVSRRSWARAFQGIYGAPEKKLDHIDRIYKHVGGEKKEILFIGDSEQDATAATAFGCRFAAVGPDCEKLSGAQFRGASLSELAAKLFGHPLS